jgi:hypothetical protein
LIEVASWRWTNAVGSVEETVVWVLYAFHSQWVTLNGSIIKSARQRQLFGVA